MDTSSPCPETFSSDQKRVIQELVHGQECATQLRILFDHPREENGHLSAEELMQNILRSFDQTISALSSINSADQVSQNQTTNCNDDEGSSESRKRPGSKDKRGCYKRKRGVETCKIISATVEDGNAWRKYGQKNILNSKYPRGYFRCTHKYEKDCKAMKQVQRMEDDPQMYEITYIGTHTCMDSFSMMIPQYSESPTVKKEAEEEIMEANSDCTDMDLMVWKEIIGSDYGFLSSNDKGVGFQNGFHFDEIVSVL